MDVIDRMSLHGEEVSLKSQPGRGIYRKGHLNERVFSYSIRQEFSGSEFPVLQLSGRSGRSNGFPVCTRRLDHDKKERELIQILHDLALSGRSPGAFRSHVTAAPSIAATLSAGPMVYNYFFLS